MVFRWDLSNFAVTMSNVTILGIESSCDDTSAAVIRDGILLSNVIASQDEACRDRQA